MGEEKMDYKLGKLPARKGAVTFKLRTYVPKLPKVPATFGHSALVRESWGMLGNDQYGDCVFAGAAHETMLWNQEAKRLVRFEEYDVLGDYSAVTGFKANDPATDQGTDMTAAASYRRKKGVSSMDGHRHKVLAYLAVKRTNLKVAAYLFGAIGVGIQFPASAMDQFNAGQPWSYVPFSKIEGGHYVPLVGFDGKYFLVITWGKIQRVTPAFLARYCDEAIAYVSAERLLADGKTLDGFNLTQLLTDLRSL